MKKALILAVCGLAALAASARAEVARDDVAWKAGFRRGLPMPQAIDMPEWARNAAAFVPQPGKPMIALVIDDVGLDRKRSARALKLPAPVTMAYLPYAPDVAEQVAAARKAGHEILVHMPMEPLGNSTGPGPDYLGTDLPPRELRRRLAVNLAAFEGYVGINNHMGSKFTQDRAGLDVVMEELADRRLLFLDSRTIADSVAEEVAREHGLPAAHRDVFLDDEGTNSFTAAALRRAEAVARRDGTAIVIGHPREITLDALEKWMPKLAEKGFQLTPLSVIVHVRNEDRAEKTALKQ